MSIRVLHVIKSLGRGGAETLLSEGYKAVNRTRFDLEYAYYLSQHHEVADLLRSQGARVHSFDAGSGAGMMRAVGRTARYLRERHIDVVHAHLPLAGVVGRLAGRLAGVPVVYTEHNPTDSYHPLTQAASWATWGLQSRAVAISEDVAASMRRHGGRRAPIVTVLNGIDTDKFSPSRISPAEAKERLGLPAEAPVVGVVAQFRAQKQLDVWIDAARLIREASPAARFVIVGNGPLWDDVRAHAARTGMDDAMLFTSVQPDVRPYVEAMDVFMMSSAYEGFGLAPVEAMAMQVPVVTFAVEGIRNVIESGKDGILVPPGAVPDLARVVLDLLHGSDARERLGRAGRETAVRLYGLPQMQRALEALYEEVVRERAAGTRSAGTRAAGTRTVARSLNQPTGAP